MQIEIEYLEHLMSYMAVSMMSEVETPIQILSEKCPVGFSVCLSVTSLKRGSNDKDLFLIGMYTTMYQ